MRCEQTKLFKLGLFTVCSLGGTMKIPLRNRRKAPFREQNALPQPVPFSAASSSRIGVLCANLILARVFVPDTNVQATWRWRDDYTFVAKVRNSPPLLDTG